MRLKWGVCVCVCVWGGGGGGGGGGGRGDNCSGFPSISISVWIRNVQRI